MLCVGGRNPNAPYNAFAVTQEQGRLADGCVLASLCHNLQDPGKASLGRLAQGVGESSGRRWNGVGWNGPMGAPAWGEGGLGDLGWFLTTVPCPGGPT